MTTQLSQVVQHDQRRQLHPLAADEVETEFSVEVLAGTVPAQVARRVDVMVWARNAAIAVQSLTLNGCRARGIFL